MLRKFYSYTENLLTDTGGLMQRFIPSQTITSSSKDIAKRLMGAATTRSVMLLAPVRKAARLGKGAAASLIGTLRAGNRQQIKELVWEWSIEIDYRR